MYDGRMKRLKEIRSRRGFSQRRLAIRAGLSFRTLQMVETGETDPRLSTIAKIATALGAPKEMIHTELDRLLGENPDSVAGISRRIRAEGDDSWKYSLFEFVDEFRRRPGQELVAMPPAPVTSEHISCLLASTVETLCQTAGMEPPWWCAGFGALDSPWFVAGVENLKATALVESPVHFRKRNIFVLANFLMRA